MAISDPIPIPERLRDMADFLCAVATELEVARERVADLKRLVERQAAAIEQLRGEREIQERTKICPES